MLGTDKDHLICDINRSGKLVELGCDPFTRAPEVKVAFTQTEGSGTKVGLEPKAQARGALEQAILDATRAEGFAGPKAVASPASQVLRLVVGLLGLEVHERPSSWAEAWLCFKDVTFTKLGLSSHEESRGVVLPASDEETEWQTRVLRHLRDHVEDAQLRREQAGYTEDGPAGHDWGPDFLEQLEVAEFALRRITHAVNILQDPEKNDRPMILREFTEEQVLKVSADLKQWLEQLATLLSLYHVHLLDMEADRRRIRTELRQNEQKFEKGEVERKNAVLRHEHFQAIFEEDRLQRRAEALLGIQMQGEDAKIYTQKDVDNMQIEWERNEIDPLRNENRDLRIQIQEQRDKLKEKENVLRDARRGGQKVESTVVQESLPKATMNLLSAALNSACERISHDGLARALGNLADSMQSKGGENLAEVIEEINRIEIPEYRPDTPPVATVPIVPESSEGSPLNLCLNAVEEQFDAMEKQFRSLPSATGANKVAFLAAWARDTVATVNSHVTSGASSKGAIRWLPPPQWDLGAIGGPDKSFRHFGVQTTGEVPQKTDGGEIEATLRKKVEGEWNRRMTRLREDLEGQLSSAQAVAERERQNAEEALQRLAEETQKADQTLAELRRKLVQMEKLLKEKGVGKAAADAIWGAGLSEFLQGRDVFERLYRDALDRMRRLAESQARFFEESSTDFLKTIGSIVDPHLKLPGMADFYAPPERPTSSERPSPRPYSGTTRTGLVSSRQTEVYPGLLTNEGGIPDLGNGAEPLKVRQLFPPDMPPPTSWPPRVPSEVKATRSLHTPLRSASGGSGAASGATGVAPAAELGILSIGGTSAMQDAAAKARGLQPPASREAKTSTPARDSRFVGNRPGSPGPAGSPMLISSATAMNIVPSDTEHTLPPLECRGQGREQRPGSQEAQQQRRMPRGGSADLRTGSPVRDLLRDNGRMERSEKASRLVVETPPLAIGSIRSASLATGSMLHPPESMGQSWTRSESGPHASQRKGRPVSQASAQRLNRNAGALSMPQLGPPRLLVQSVGSVY